MDSNIMIDEEVMTPPSDSLQNDEYVINIEHSLNGNVFKHRSSYKIQPLLNYKVTPLESDKNGISSDSVDDFKALLTSNDFYQIRISSQLGAIGSDYVLSSIPACELQKSNFKEDISLYLDETNNYIIGISYSSPVVAVSRPCNANKIDGPVTFLSRVKVVEKITAQAIPLVVTGPRPPQLEKVRLEGDNEEQHANANQNQSFLRKYWYLVIPMILFLFAPTDAGDKKGAAAEKKAQ